MGISVPIGVFSLRYSHIFLPSVKKYGGILFAPRKEIFMNQEDIKRIEESIGYEFSNRALPEQAFTTKAHANEDPDAEHYGLHEHSGDKWLEIAVHHAIMTHRTRIDEKGRLVSEYNKDDMSRLEDRIVNNKNLAARMEDLDLEQYLIMSQGEKQNHCENSLSIRSKLFEAIIGAVAVDSGYDLKVISRVVLRMMGATDWEELLSRHEEA
jgi:ribonuclease-3